MQSIIIEIKTLSGQISVPLSMIRQMLSQVVLAPSTVPAALSAGGQAVVGQAAPHNVAIFVADGLQSFGNVDAGGFCGRALRLSQPPLVEEHHFGLPN
jgi:hypothetical protein